MREECSARSTTPLLWPFLGKVYRTVVLCLFLITGFIDNAESHVDDLNENKIRVAIAGENNIISQKIVDFIELDVRISVIRFDERENSSRFDYKIFIGDNSIIAKRIDGGQTQGGYIDKILDQHDFIDSFEDLKRVLIYSYYMKVYQNGLEMCKDKIVCVLKSHIYISSIFRPLFDFVSLSEFDASSTSGAWPALVGDSDFDLAFSDLIGASVIEMSSALVSSILETDSLGIIDKTINISEAYRAHNAGVALRWVSNKKLNTRNIKSINALEIKTVSDVGMVYQIIEESQILRVFEKYNTNVEKLYKVLNKSRNYNCGIFIGLATLEIYDKKYALRE